MLANALFVVACVAGLFGVLCSVLYVTACLLYVFSDPSRGRW